MTNKEGGDRSARGFTLTELLVVMVIVSMLAAMLLPAVKAVREQGRSAACVNNLRQMGNAFFMYLQDNDETVMGRGDNAHPPFWFNALKPCLNNNTNVFRCLSNPNHQFNFSCLSYGYNIYIQGNSADVTLFIRHSSISKPAAKYFLMDSDGDKSVDYLVSSALPPNIESVGTRHKNGANVLFFDGHVNWFSAADLVVSDGWKDMTK
ncbi:MAG: prepilin-type N-terminal cleavage/methylation domain-containing protein [Verrucomicrobiae bacterium]|nr:prepilin-type N-terminal cleavage/methylation domain-containing protein [Verrucomicrobiae bacterium]